MTNPSPTAVLVICAAPPAAKIVQLIELLQRDRWDVYPVLTESAAAWVDIASLEAASGHAIRIRPRSPTEERSLPPADAVIVAPATFNTINLWAAGVNNSAVLGVLNEALGARAPIIVSPYAKAALAAHPAFGRNLQLLADAGARLTVTDALRPTTPDGPFQWACILDLLATVR